MLVSYRSQENKEVRNEPICLNVFISLEQLDVSLVFGTRGHYIKKLPRLIISNSSTFQNLLPTSLSSFNIEILAPHGLHSVDTYSSIKMMTYFRRYLKVMFLFLKNPQSHSVQQLWFCGACGTRKKAIFSFRLSMATKYQLLQCIRSSRHIKVFEL